MEAPPAIPFDLYPYNRATARLCEKRSIHYRPTLIGESHLFRKDGYHIQNQHRPLLTRSIAAAVLLIDPHLHFNIQSPPSGPYGPWKLPFNHPRRPKPSLRWPPLDALLHHPHNLRRDLPRTHRNIAASPPYWLNGPIRPLMYMNIRTN